MSLPESVLPPLAADAFATTENALGELPCGPPYSARHVQSVLEEKKPTTFDGAVKALGSAGSSTLAFVASVYKDAPRTAATLAGPFIVTEPTGHVGDLHVQGDLTLEKSLVVVGDLTVDGVLHDGEHTKLVVVGQVRCRAMHTSGWVTILGGLTVEHALYGRYNDDSVEVLGPITAGLIVSDDHLIYGKPKTAKLRPSQGGAWGPDTFDARDRAHKAELPKVLVDGITSLDEDGEVKVDGEKLVAARPPWK
ncbi:hypothetical protein OWM54_16980 [Myxococcus sp. MISCRS1]|uniref:hypothetical protein n=1 Tax=Myxococcus sp. MISCRS1 TaxID=2996786 RepID=UPI002271CB1D|nr:hypothetical protein [Myxococcus sp. MISCRS1]MCY0998836.1 hypothetical protein [Myxococcus sp. MISCRS1]